MVGQYTPSQGSGRRIAPTFSIFARWFISYLHCWLLAVYVVKPTRACRIETKAENFLPQDQPMQYLRSHSIPTNQIHLRSVWIHCWWHISKKAPSRRVDRSSTLPERTTTESRMIHAKGMSPVSTKSRFGYDLWICSTCSSDAVKVKMANIRCFKYDDLLEFLEWTVSPQQRLGSGNS